MGDSNPWNEAMLAESVAALEKYVDSLLANGCPADVVEALVDAWIAANSDGAEMNPDRGRP